MLFQHSLYILILLGIYVLSFLIQMLHWWLLHARILYYRPPASRPRKIPVSVIICARNEEENLRNNLPLILEQEYPDYEVIVVNDSSNDGTEEVLRQLKEKYPRLRSTSITESPHHGRGKKLALTVGIKSAVNDWVLLTDADCVPAGKKWISRMQGNFTKTSSVVLGYGPYRRRKGLLNLVIRYEAFFIALQYLGYAIAGRPYMGVGRNLAYRKELFFSNKGFAGHYELDSGDDDLFVNEVARAGNTRVEIRPGALTLSEPHSSWKDWYYQKKRHLTTGFRYRRGTKFLLGTELMSRLAFYASFILLLLSTVLLPYVLGLFLLRFLSTIVIIKLGMTRLEERYLLLISPLLDIVLPLTHIFMVFSNYVATNKARWT